MFRASTEGKQFTEVVGRDLEKINGRFYCHRGEINCLKIREKDAKEEVEKLKGFVVGAGHEAQLFKDCLDRMEENVCKCGQTPSEVGEEFVSSEDETETELSYASAPERSTWLLLLRIPFQSPFQLWFLHVVLAPPLLLIPWKRLQKKLLSSVKIWMGS